MTLYIVRYYFGHNGEYKKYMLRYILIEESKSIKKIIRKKIIIMES